MTFDLFDRIDAWLLALVFALGTLLAIEAGYRAGCRMPATDGAESGPMTGGILAIVGLLLGFTFSFDAARYDLRRHLVVAEANAIGTAYLRADLVHQPERDALRSGLRAYLDARIADDATATQRIARDLWSSATSAAAADSRPIVGLAVTSLTEVFDAAEGQADADRNRLPPVIGVLLAAIVAISSAVIGLGAGAARARRPVSAIAYALVTALTIFAIAELDRPGTGTIQTDRTALVALRASLDR